MTHELLDRAITFAVKKHSGAFRKGTGIPYILHPMEAAAIAATMTDDIEVLAAAVLHDVAEDAGVTREKLDARFGRKVADLVAAESEEKSEGQDKSATWRVRKEESIDELRSTADINVKIVALNDKLSNMRNIYRDYTSIGEEFWNRFNQKDKNQHA